MSRSAMWVFSKASNWYRIINTALSRPPSMAFGLSPRSTLGRAVDGFGRVFERAHPVALGAAVGVTAFFTRDYADVRRGDKEETLFQLWKPIIYEQLGRPLPDVQSDSDS
eukprot:TRINITY_DN2348_c0_g1_i1.p1 TRINITY_DN2348_c0_g1~~TRINITY_DN2348_c0_g1_i1.p1  ORF type:complete len:110 (-),score=15.40 TRINITY_DN2348_c0_g1_i1:422-751(-)